MKAVRIHSFGSTDVLELEDIAIPEPAANEVRIKVRAAGVNPIDFKMRSGQFHPAELHPPLTLGREVAGVVDRVGAEVRDVSVGDEVYALLGLQHGGYAEYALARPEELAAKPAKLAYPEAAGVPLAAITAWQGLFDHGKLKNGERVLIHGASGGVGHFAVQFAKLRGAFVVATARSEDEDLLRQLGADEVIDYRRTVFEDRTRDIDLVLDLVAGDTQDRSWSILKPGGRMISTLQPPSEEEAARHQARGAAFMATPRHDQLEKIGRLIDRGDVKVVIDRAIPLAEVRQAHRHLEREHVRGKIVLTVAG